jgi:hypothetical protein
MFPQLSKVNKLTLIGIQFENKDIEFIERIKLEIEHNSSKPASKLLFNIDVFTIGGDILLINKEFIPGKTLKYVYLLALLCSSIPIFLWGVTIPFFIVCGLILFWTFINTPFFNYFMFKIMIRRMGYIGGLRLL